MLLSKLLKGIEHIKHNYCDTEVSYIQHDSRKIENGNMYVCLKGLSFDGHDFATSACNLGATVVLVENFIKDLDVIQIEVKDAREAYSRIASNWYENPHEQLKIIAVTGTNGKTTTTHIIRTILEEKGIKTAVLGTIGAYICGEIHTMPLTTPDPMDFHYFLKLITDKGCKYVVMETSAHALYLKKTEPVIFEIGVFTNFTQDHLDDFETMDNYLKAKKMLFEGNKCKTAIINLDDGISTEIIKDFEGKLVSYSTEKDADYFADDISCGFGDVSYDLITKEGKYRTLLNIPGRFNVLNSLAAIGVCRTLGLDMKSIIDGLNKVVNVDGRMERVDFGQDFMVLIDYAHSPDSLKNALKAACGFTKNRVISLFGCGGDRDKLKRPIMGTISNDIADFTIITSDNPRTENPDSIIDMIEKGMRNSEYIRITDRKEAIVKSLEMAQKGDVIVIAGKGHETYQDIMGKKHHFDDREIVKEYFEGNK